MGNGFPIGGVLIHPEIEAWHGMLGTTFGGNHLACAAAIAVLEVMKEESLVQNAEKTGNYLIEKLSELNAGFEIRGKGLMIGLEFKQPVQEIRNLLIEYGIFTGVSGQNVIRLLPPLCLTISEADEFLKAFGDILTTVNI
jgi:acetylornithine aminotransferase